MSKRRASVAGDISRAFGLHVRQARIQAGLSLREVATKAGLSSQTTVHRVEHGDGCSLAAAALIARALGRSLDELTTQVGCSNCNDMPWPNFICAACGKRGETQ